MGPRREFTDPAFEIVPYSVKNRAFKLNFFAASLRVLALSEAILIHKLDKMRVCNRNMHLRYVQVYYHLRFEDPQPRLLNVRCTVRC